MTRTGRKQLCIVVACATLVALLGDSVSADDTEIFEDIGVVSTRPDNSPRPQEMCRATSLAYAMSVTVNPLNKTQLLEDIYVAAFSPSTKPRWPGRINKFKLRNGSIVGQDKTINETGRTSIIASLSGSASVSAKGLWPQHDDLTNGAIASDFPRRIVYTYISRVTHPRTPIALVLHPFATANNDITDKPDSLNLSSKDPSRDALINWALGDPGENTAQTNAIHHEMGASIHALPAVVVYGKIGESDNDRLNDAVVYVATNDGYLHALDARTGRELWAYMPQELLGNLKFLYADNPSATKRYSLDGNIRIVKYDVDGDGIVEPANNDRVFLYFSQGRGGDNYYALDVTEKLNPKFLWNLSGAKHLSGIVRQSWSTPTLGRVRVGDGSKQNLQKFVLIFGGGYSDDEDGLPYVPGGDKHGNALFMVDAVNGTVLWHQTKATRGAFANMTHAIPSDVTVLDTNNDGWTDRMYVGDLAGQLWRMDVLNGNIGNVESGDETDALVVGGVIASLGGKVSPTVANNRSFFSAPDVAKIIARGTASYYNLSIGSGDRVLPRTNITTDDRFYSLRDYHLEPMTQAQYNAAAPVTDSGDDTGLTSVNGEDEILLPNKLRGWKLPLQGGEKVLAKSVTVNGSVIFTTYLPNQASSGCIAPKSNARAYTLDVRKGLKQFDSLYESFTTNGLPTEVATINKGMLVRTDGSKEPPNTDTGSICWSGVTLLTRCVAFGERVKTFWKDAGVN